MVTVQKSWKRKALRVSGTILSLFIVVILFLGVIDGGMSWTKSGVLSAEGFELRDGRVVDTQLTIAHSAPEVDEQIEQDFELGMNEDALATYYSAYSVLFAPPTEGDSDLESLERFQQTLGHEAEAAMDAYEDAGCNLFSGSNGGTKFLRSILMQSAHIQEAGFPERSSEILEFSINYLASPKWYSSPEDIGYFYDAKSWNMLLYASDHFGLIREMDPYARQKLVHQISGTLDILQATPWRRTWKRTIAQAAVDAFENNDPWATAMFESAGARFRLKLYQRKGILANMAIRSDLESAFAICNGRDVIPPFFFNDMSEAATNAMQSTEANYAVLRLKLRLLAYVILIENYRDGTGHLPTDFDQLEATDLLTDQTLEVTYRVENDAYTLSLKQDDHVESWPRTQDTLTARR